MVRERDRGGMHTEPENSPAVTARANPTIPIRSLLPSVVLNVVVPVVGYELLRTPLHSQVLALAIGAAVPVAWTLGRLTLARRIDPVGLISSAGFGIGLLVAWLSGGNPIMLELRDALPSGLLGVAFLVATAIGRPLTAVLGRLLARRDPRAAPIAANPGRWRVVTVLNVLIGVLLVVHAAALTVLALNVSLGTYVLVSKPVGWGILLVGVVALLAYRRRTLATPPAQAS